MPALGWNGVERGLGSRSSADDFAAFYRCNYQAALNLVRCRTVGCDCEALVADSFLIAWQHLEDTGELNRGWFFGVVRNRIGDFYRSGRRREIASDPCVFMPAIEDPGHRSDTRMDVHRALQTLSPIHSEPLLLVYWCDLTGAEAADALGIREGTLRVRLHRAQRAFSREYERGMDSTQDVDTQEVGTWIA